MILLKLFFFRNASKFQVSLLLYRAELGFYIVCLLLLISWSNLKNLWVVVGLMFSGKISRTKIRETVNTHSDKCSKEQKMLIKLTVQQSAPVLLNKLYKLTDERRAYGADGYSTGRMDLKSEGVRQK